MGKRFRQLTQTATDLDLVEGNYFGVDTLNVTKKVPANLLAKQSSLETTNGNVTSLTTYAQNVAHSIAPEFDPTRTAGNKYLAGERVMHGGLFYRFKNDHYGAWVPADAERVDVDTLFKNLPLDFCTNEVLTRLVGNRLDDSQFVKGAEVSEHGKTIISERGDSGLCPCLPKETLYFWREGEANPNMFNNIVSFYDIAKNYIGGQISSATIRKQVVPANAFYFSIPIKWVDDVPQKTVVANYLPSGFVPYATSSEKTSKAVVSANCPTNVYDPSAVTHGSHITAIQEGSEVWTTASGRCETDFIKIPSRLLYCYYDDPLHNPKNTWPALDYVTTYDEQKNPLRVFSIGSSGIVALPLLSGEKYVRISLSENFYDKCCFGYEMFEGPVPYGYTPRCLFTKDIANEAGNSEVMAISQKATTELFSSNELLTRLVGNRLDDSQFVKGVEVSEGGATIVNSERGYSGLCPCLPGETLYFWREGEANPNKFYNIVSFYDIAKNYIGGQTSSATIRKQVVPSNAFYFSIPIKWVDDAPQKTVVANYLPSGFVTYSASLDKSREIVDSAYCPQNIFDPSAATIGSYISAVSGGVETWTEDASLGMTDYIHVPSRLLFCYYNYNNIGNKWPFIYYVTYDENKQPLRRAQVGSGKPFALYLTASEVFVKIQFTMSRINSISIGYNLFNSFVPYGYTPRCLFTKDIANEAGNSEVMAISQKAATELFRQSGAEPEDFELDVTGMETDVICTARNYILKEYEENSTRFFEFSNDCGKTFTKVENTIGQINFVHFFSTGRVLICGATKCYYTDDFETFEDTAVYDYDGSAFVANTHHFYRLGNYNSEYNVLDGQEVLVWNDYNTETGYKSRVWFTDDYGVTLRCILKDVETLDSDGNLIDVTHFHRTWLENDTGKLWVTSGDVGDLCKLLCGHIENGDWVWDLINKGVFYKLSQFVVRRPYAYFVTDYTDGQNPTGIACCPISGIADPTNFRYLYKTANNEALSKYFEDDHGYRVILPDGIGTRKMWFANGNFDFKQISIIGGSGNIVLGNMYGSNYNGDVIVNYHTNGYGAASNPNMNLYPRLDFSAAMRKAGFRNFGKIMKLVYKGID